MNKKVLSAILFSALFAGTGTFTSCIDNDEPAGIEELRGAKAELLRAKVAVEQAEASLRLAQAEVQKALAAKNMADAEISKALAAINQAKADSINVKTEQERAALELKIERNKMKLDSLKVLHQIEMNKINASLAQSQRSYEIMMAQIEIAKAVGSSKDYVTISELQRKARRAQGWVEYAQGEVNTAQAEYNWWVAYDDTHSELHAKRLEAYVAAEEDSLALAQATLAKWEGYLENAESADWVAEVKELDDSLAAIKKDTVGINLEIAKIKASDEYAKLVADTAIGNYTGKADSVYGHKYFGQDYAQTLVWDKATEKAEFTTGETEADAEDAKAVVINEATLALIATYNDAGELTGGRLYDDKDSLATFTAETRHFLDTIAAEAEGNTKLLDDSNDAIEAWTEALKAYNEADTTMAHELDTLNAKLANWSQVADKSALKFDTLRKALLDYYTAAVNNEATLNKLLTYKGEVVVEVAVAGTNTYEKDTVASYGEEELLTILADSTKAYYSFVTLFDGFALENAKNEGETTDTITVFDAATKKNKKFTVSKYAMSEAPMTVRSETEKDENTYLGQLQIASEAAFGTASQYLQELEWPYTHAADGYLHVMPDTADVKNLNAYQNKNASELGAFGKYVLAQDGALIEYAKNYKSIMANLEAAIAYWEATYKTLNAKYTAGSEAYNDAKDALELYEEENIEPLTKKVEAVAGKVSRIKTLAVSLLDAIMAYLPSEFEQVKDQYSDFEVVIVDKNDPIASYDKLTDNLAAFIEFLEDEVETAKTAVVEAEDDLANAKMWETLIENGKSGVELAKENLDAKIAKLEEAQAKLEEALANVAKGLEIIAAVNGTEDAE